MLQNKDDWADQPARDSDRLPHLNQSSHSATDQQSRTRPSSRAILGEFAE